MTTLLLARNLFWRPVRGVGGGGDSAGLKTPIVYLLNIFENAVAEYVNKYPKSFTPRLVCVTRGAVGEPLLIVSVIPITPFKGQEIH